MFDRMDVETERPRWQMGAEPSQWAPDLPPSSLAARFPPPIDIPQPSYEREYPFGAALRPSSAEKFLYDPPHVNLSTFKQHLQRAVDGAVSPVARNYTAVRCLLLSWQDDPIGCVAEIQELSDVFVKQYGFEVEAYLIPSQNAFMSLQWKLMDFQRQATERGELIILYYGGHAGQTREGQAIWQCSRAAEPSIRWHILQDLVGQFPSDMLFIFDCCRAAAAARTTAIGRKEMLGACGWENRTPVGIHNQTSYTAVLIRELKKFNSPFTVAQLHSSMVREKGLQPKTLESTPFHCLLSEDDVKQIVFYPRREAQPENSLSLLQLPMEMLPPISPTETGSHSMGSESGDDVGSLTQAGSSANTVYSPSPGFPKILLSIHLSALPDLRDFERWVTTHIPRVVSGIDIHVEGAFPSTSTILVLSVPILVWSLLPREEEYKVLGFMTAPKLRSRAPRGRTRDWFEETVIAVVAAKRIVRKRRRTTSMSSMD